MIKSLKNGKSTEHYINKIKNPEEVTTYNTLLRNELLNCENFNLNAFGNLNLKKSTISLLNKREKLRILPKKQYKILEAIGLEDDFYKNVLDWSSKDIIAVALKNILYLYFNKSQETFKIREYGEYEICSLKFSKDGRYLAVGTSHGNLDIIDIHTLQLVTYYNFESHLKIYCIDWKDFEIICGFSNGTFAQFDTLTYGHGGIYNGHTPNSKICNLKWSRDGKYFSSGGDDNKLMIWSNNKKSTLFTFNAAVKAMDWSRSNYNYITCGGGTNDRTIRTFSISSMKCIREVYTGSQVCNLFYSKSTNEIVSTHGFSNNEINCWKENFTKIASLTGHTSRTLYASLSPNGENLVTGANEELRFWKIFPRINNNINKKSNFIYSNRQFIR